MISEYQWTTRLPTVCVQRLGRPEVQSTVPEKLISRGLGIWYVPAEIVLEAVNACTFTTIRQQRIGQLVRLGLGICVVSQKPSGCPISSEALNYYSNLIGL